jgi:diguanylate cyclase (GGDEF)-like protein
MRERQRSIFESRGRDGRWQSMPARADRGLWTGLTRPFSSVEDKIKRHDAQLLSQLLLLLFPLGLLLFLLPGLIRPERTAIDEGDVYVFFIAMLGWLISSLIARTRHYRWAAGTAVWLSAAILMWYTIVDQSLEVAYYIAIPVIVSGMLLSLTLTAALAATCTLVLYLTPVLRPGISFIDLILSPISFLSISSTLILIFIRYRDRVRLDREEEITQLYEKAQTEIQERESAEKELLHNAFHDGLTRLPNRALFYDRLDQALLRSKRQGEALVGVMFLDLDQFKDVNDSLGHSAGDDLLTKIAGRLQAAIREVDTVARFGGDEFVVLVENVADTTDVTRIARRIQESLEAPFLIGKERIFTSASIGIVLCGREYTRPEEILRDADIAMYQAKEAGGAGHQIYRREMRERRLSRIKLENDLRWAVHNNELLLFFQPIISLQTEELSGFEALVRWNHPEVGLIFPAEFISVAEETDLILPIGRWALGEACCQIAKWRREPNRGNGLQINVNVSARELVQPSFLDQVMGTLEATGVLPAELNLEITESVLIEQWTMVSDILHRLSDSGIGIQLDDFGTGYSSLSQISRLPIDSMKIDRSFVSGLDADKSNLGIIRSVIEMGKQMGLRVYAEGVEAAWQLSLLRDLGADFGQGYFICRPNDREAIEAYIRSLTQVTA